MKLLGRIVAALAATAAFGVAVGAQELVVGGIVMQQDQYHRGIQMGFEDWATSGGITLLQGSSDGRLEREAELIDTFIARGAKALVVVPLNPDASIPALQRAAEAGLAVVLFGAKVNADFPVSFVGTSHAEIGRYSGQAAAKFIAEELGGKANVAILGFRSQFQQPSDDRTNGFLETAKADSNELTVVSTQEAWLAEQSVTVTTDMLTAHPEIQVIYAANEGGTVGAVQAVRAAGLEGKVFVFGTDGSEQLANFLLDPDGVLVATTAQQPFYVGKQAMEAAAAAVTGQPVEAEYEIPPFVLNRAEPDTIKTYLEQAKQ